MDGQKSFFCIMAGQEARTKAMKIAVSAPGNYIYIYIYIYQHVVYVCIYTYIVFIKEIEMIKIIYILFRSICRGGSSKFERGQQGPDRGEGGRD
jgi:hypothetical protein